LAVESLLITTESNVSALITAGLLPILRDWLKQAVDGKETKWIIRLLELLLSLPIDLKSLKQSKVGAVVAKLGNSTSPAPTGNTRSSEELRVVEIANAIYKRWSSAAQDNVSSTAPAAAATSSASTSSASTSSGASKRSSSSLSSSSDQPSKKLKKDDSASSSASSLLSSLPPMPSSLSSALKGMGAQGSTTSTALPAVPPSLSSVLHASSSTSASSTSSSRHHAPPTDESLPAASAPSSSSTASTTTPLSSSVSYPSSSSNPVLHPSAPLQQLNAANPLGTENALLFPPLSSLSLPGGGSTGGSGGGSSASSVASTASFDEVVMVDSGTEDLDEELDDEEYGYWVEPVDDGSGEVGMTDAEKGELTRVGGKGLPDKYGHVKGGILRNPVTGFVGGIAMAEKLLLKKKKRAEYLLSTSEKVDEANREVDLLNQRRGILWIDSAVDAYQRHGRLAKAAVDGFSLDSVAAVKFFKKELAPNQISAAVAASVGVGVTATSSGRSGAASSHGSASSGAAASSGREDDDETQGSDVVEHDFKEALKRERSSESANIKALLGRESSKLSSMLSKLSTSPSAGGAAGGRGSRFSQANMGQIPMLPLASCAPLAAWSVHGAVVVHEDGSKVQSTHPQLKSVEKETQTVRLQPIEFVKYASRANVPITPQALHSAWMHYSPGHVPYAMQNVPATTPYTLYPWQLQMQAQTVGADAARSTSLGQNKLGAILNSLKSLSKPLAVVGQTNSAATPTVSSLPSPALPSPGSSVLVPGAVAPITAPAPTAFNIQPTTSNLAAIGIVVPGVTPTAASTPAPVRVIAKPTRACLFFNTPAGCRFAERCTFRHDPA
jgi:TFIIS helical bundle-like domain